MTNNKINNMKKLAIAFSFFFFTGIVLHAQDLKKAKSAYTMSLVKPESIENAKVEVDKLMTDEKLNKQAESYLLKMQVYSAIAANEAIAAKYPEIELQAFDALKKYLELEPGEDKLKADRYDGVNGIYNIFFKKGVKFYQEEKWDQSFEKFKNMAALGEILIERKWSNSAFDTTSHLYAAATAQNAKKDKDAVFYYSKLADIKVSGKDYEGVYEYLTKYFLNNPDETQFKKYIAIAKEVYPEQSLWKDLEFEFTKKNSDIQSFVTKFKAEDATNTLTSEQYSEYGSFFATDDKIKDLPEDQRTPYNNMAFYAFKKAYDKDTTNGVAGYNAGVTAYGQFETKADSARSFKGTTVEIKNQRTAANKVALDAADLSVTWLEKAHRSLAGKTERSNLEKGLLNKSVDLLYNVYEYKRDMSRGVSPKDYDLFDAKLTYYNSLHGKY